MKVVLVLCVMAVLIHTLYDNGQEDHITVNQMIALLLGMIIIYNNKMIIHSISAIIISIMYKIIMHASSIYFYTCPF